MTPAEKPVAIDKKRKSVRLAKNARALPIPVARPAKSVNPKSNPNIFHSGKVMSF